MAWTLLGVAARTAGRRAACSSNLVDFDTLYGHRNDVAGYAGNLERFDARLAELLPQLREDDLLVVTADHGNDPTTPSTDHSREYVPLLVTGARVRRGRGAGDPRHVRRSRRRRWPRCSACRRCRHGTSFLQGDRVTIREHLEQRERGDPGAAGGQERRQPWSAASGDRGSGAAGVPARPRSHHPHEGVPPAEAQDAGVLLAARRSLPDAADPHARGVADRAHHRQGAPPARGADRGHRARPRPGPHAFRPRRGAGAERARARRLQPLRAEPAHRRRAGTRPAAA